MQSRLLVLLESEDARCPKRAQNGDDPTWNATEMVKSALGGDTAEVTGDLPLLTSPGVDVWESLTVQ